MWTSYYGLWTHEVGDKALPFLSFFLFSLAMHLVCGIRVLQWETEHMPLALEAWSLNHWTTKEVPNSFHLYSHLGATLFLDTSRFIIEDLSYDCVYKLSSVQFSSVPSLSRVRLFAIPSPTPGTCSNLCLSSQWCHPTISSSVIPFSSCLQSFPASRSFPMSQLFASGGQSIQLPHQYFQWIFSTDFL